MAKKDEARVERLILKGVLSEMPADAQQRVEAMKLRIELAVAGEEEDEATLALALVALEAKQT